MLPGSGKGGPGQHKHLAASWGVTWCPQLSLCVLSRLRCASKGLEHCVYFVCLQKSYWGCPRWLRACLTAVGQALLQERTGMMSGPCPQKHQLSTLAATPALPGGVGSLSQHHCGRAGYWPCCATSSSDGPVHPGLACSRTRLCSASQPRGRGRSTHLCSQGSL